MTKFSIEYSLEVNDFIYDESSPEHAFSEVENFGEEAILDDLEDSLNPPEVDDVQVEVRFVSFTDEDPSVALALFRVDFSSDDEDLLEDLKEQLDEEGYVIIG